MKKDGLNRTIGFEEFKENSSDKKPWFIVNGEVYDGHAFLEGHPGGAQSIVSSAGLDVSEEFLAIRESQIYNTANIPFIDTHPQIARRQRR